VAIAARLGSARCCGVRCALLLVLEMTWGDG
jgi:hypothetical protein